MDKDVKYVPIFSYELALFLTHEGWVVHHTAPNKENHNLKVYYFNFAPGIYEDMNKYRSIKEDKPIGQHITKRFRGEPDYSVPIYDNKMVRFLIDLGFKIERVEVYVSEVDNSRRRVTYFKYRWGLYHGIQQYMNRQDKTKRKKANKQVKKEVAQNV